MINKNGLYQNPESVSKFNVNEGVNVHVVQNNPVEQVIDNKKKTINSFCKKHLKFMVIGGSLLSFCGAGGYAILRIDANVAEIVYQLQKLNNNIHKTNKSVHTDYKIGTANNYNP